MKKALFPRDLTVCQYQLKQLLMHNCILVCTTFENIDQCTIIIIDCLDITPAVFVECDLINHKTFTIMQTNSCGILF